MRYGWISTNLLDMRAKGDHHSERVSQARFGAPMRLGRSQSGFVCIREMDGYSGWVDKRFVVSIPSGREFQKYWMSLDTVVVAPRVRVYDSTGRPVPPFWLFYGTMLSLKKKKGALLAINLPGHNGLFVKRRNLRPISNCNGQTVTGPKVVAQARKFLGVPYLWGGVSPLGFDCSGLVQAVFRSYGVVLPRDTADQIGMGHDIPRAGIRSGDLLFFDRHVALALDRSRFIHASRGSGGVRIESLSASDPDYRADLDREFVKARRVLL